MADEDKDKMRAIMLGDWVREMVAAGESREESDAVIAAAARFTWWGEDCREVYGMTAREWAVLTREQSRLNPGKRELTPAELQQRRNAAQNAGRPPKQKSGEIGEIGEIGLSQRGEEDEDGEKKQKRNPKIEVARETRAPSSGTSVLNPSQSSDFGTWAQLQEDPVTVALAAAGEGKGSARVFGSLLKDFRALRGKEDGTRLFVEECVSFEAEIRAGEEVRNKGAALVSRLSARREAWKQTPPPAVASPAPVAVEGVPPVEAVPAQTLAGIVAAVADPFKRNVPPPKTEAEIEEERERQLRRLAEWKRTHAAGAGVVA